jgi:hypothetical protein
MPARFRIRSQMAHVKWLMSRTRSIAYGLCSRTLISQSILAHHVIRPSAIGFPNRTLSSATGVTEEIVQSLSVLKVQAESGNIIAQFNLGQAYLNGHHGLAKSPADAIFWIKR